MSELFKRLKELGITCTPKKVTFSKSDVVVSFKTDDSTQFAPFANLVGDPVVLLVLHPAQGELAFTEGEQTINMSVDGDIGLDDELPLDDEPEAVCPECNAPAEDQCVTNEETGGRVFRCLCPRTADTNSKRWSKRKMIAR